jgi:hypothetical protein
MSTTMLPDLNLLPAEALKALVRAQHEQLLWRENEIEHLKLLIAKLQRMQFGRKSENRVSATVVRSDTAEAFAQVGHDGGDSLRALTLGCVAALFERRKH